MGKREELLDKTSELEFAREKLEGEDQRLEERGGDMDL